MYIALSTKRCEYLQVSLPIESPLAFNIVYNHQTSQIRFTVHRFHLILSRQSPPLMQ